MLGKTEGRRRSDDRGGDSWVASLFNGHELEQALAVGNGQGSLCVALHGVTESDMTG